MELVKKTKTHKIFLRNDKRYAVKTRKGAAVNGDEKVELLIAEGLMTKPEPKPEPVAEETEAAEGEETTQEDAE